MSEQNENVITFNILTSPFNLALRINEFERQKEEVDFIKKIEKLVRNSHEFGLWRKYIIDNISSKCVVTNEEINECKVDVHHHIPTLFTLSKAVMAKEISAGNKISTFDIALKVIELHYRNKIGYITLIKSLHEKFHNGFLKIPSEYIMGDYRWFLNEYSRYLETEELAILTERLEIQESNVEWSRDNYPGMNVV